MYLLGISAFYHDSAACLIQDGEVIAAVQEERFTRIKHDSSFPKKSILYCLDSAKILPSELTHVVFYEKPFIKFERLLETYLAYAPKGFFSFSKSMPIWIKDKLFQKSNLIKELNLVLGNKINWDSRLLFSEHHLSHAASAFYPSPFENAVILTLDGVGEWTTTSLAIGKGKNIKILKEIHFPHSLGLLYSSFTYYTGFKVNSGEYKLMGLAPYGEPKYVDLIKKNLIRIFDDGSFQLDMTYFNYTTGFSMTNKKFDNLFGAPPRKPESEITQRDMDLASSVQKVTEEIVLKLARSATKETGEKNLCLAGGVALNCVVNGLLHREKIFDNIWIQPAAGDAGGALGAALSAWYSLFAEDRLISLENDSMKGSYLGPEFSDFEIEKVLKENDATYHHLTENDLIESVSNLLTKGKAIGWMQGRMEFGPRALGARSIIADPRSSIMQKQLNLKVKYRESFRPFAPSILSEHVHEWFEHDSISPYMLLVAKVKKNRRVEVSKKDLDQIGFNKLRVVRSSIPAITHVDYSARIQTVHKETNKKYHSLINSFFNITGFPIVVNTSFNVRGEPIVCSPDDAYSCFLSTEMDALAIGNFLLIKKEQDHNKIKNYQKKYELD